MGIPKLGPPNTEHRHLLKIGRHIQYLRMFKSLGYFATSSRVLISSIEMYIMYRMRFGLHLWVAGCSFCCFPGLGFDNWDSYLAFEMHFVVQNSYIQAVLSVYSILSIYSPVRQLGRIEMHWGDAGPKLAFSPVFGCWVEFGNQDSGYVLWDLGCIY